MGEALTRYHICLDVADRPGVLAAVAGRLRPARGLHRDRAARRAAATRPTLVIVTHAARRTRALAATVAELRAELDIVRVGGQRAARSKASTSNGASESACGGV